jgi:hypothetical protein
MEQIAGMAGIKLTQVPFKGGAETNAAVLGQHTMLQADSTGWRPLVDAGKLRLLMVWTSARSPNFPNVPTLKELGYPMVYDSPFGIAGPEDGPKIVAKLHAFKKALRTRRDRDARQVRYGSELQESPRTTRSSSSRSTVRAQGDRDARPGEEGELDQPRPGVTPRAGQSRSRGGEPHLRRATGWISPSPSRA